MARIAVDPARLTAAVDRMARVEADLLGRLDEAERAVQRLGSSWSGAAAEAHRARHQRWTAAAAELNDALARMRRIAAVAEHNYTSAINANQAMWGAR
jgi:WXG100 family type VII secretion target